MAVLRMAALSSAETPSANPTLYCYERSVLRDNCRIWHQLVASQFVCSHRVDICSHFFQAATEVPWRHLCDGSGFFSLDIADREGAFATELATSTCGEQIYELNFYFRKV